MAAPQRRRRALGQSVTAAGARRLLWAHASPAKAVTLQRSFKTGPGQYAAGDRFTVPRTMLGYAVERLPASSRRRHLDRRAHAR